MAQTELKAPASPYDGPATRDTGDERGTNWKAFVQACQAMFTELYNALTNVVNATTAGKKIAGGAYTVTAGDDTAGSADIPTGLTSVDSFIVQIQRSGVIVTDDAIFSEASGTITAADGATTYALTANDVVEWMAFGT